jgi:hypothetical protein
MISPGFLLPAREKVATDESLKQRALEGFVGVRPYVSSGLKTGIPAAVMGKLLVGEGKVSTRAGQVLGVLGATAGVADEALKQWASRNKRRKAARTILKAASWKMRKAASMAGDLRRTGIGGVKRPAFPTDDSKRMAERALKASQREGRFGGGLRLPKTPVQPTAPKPLKLSGF